MRRILILVAGSILGACVTTSIPTSNDGNKQPALMEENYDFLAVTTGQCIPKIGVGIEKSHQSECQRMTEPRLYRGTWQVEFEGSFFTPVGRQNCLETKGGACIELAGKVLPWPSRWACPRRYEVVFVGRRNALPGLFGGSVYKIVVDRLITAKRLPDPPHEPTDCDAAAP